MPPSKNTAEPAKSARAAVASRRACQPGLAIGLRMRRRAISALGNRTKTSPAANSSRSTRAPSPEGLGGGPADGAAMAQILSAAARRGPFHMIPRVPGEILTFVAADGRALGGVLTLPASP